MATATAPRLWGLNTLSRKNSSKPSPPTKKKLWHSHRYEVESGELIAPGLPNVAEHELMEQVVSTYGKTWHTDQDLDLPLGSPALMMGFTRDGQLNPRLLRDRDKRFGVSTDDKRKNREDIPLPAIQSGADSWQAGEIVQLPALTGHKHQHVQQGSFSESKPKK
jgi:hypothetical protein